MSNLLNDLMAQSVILFDKQLSVTSLLNILKVVEDTVEKPVIAHDHILLPKNMYDAEVVFQLELLLVAIHKNFQEQDIFGIIKAIYSCTLAEFVNLDEIARILRTLRIVNLS